MKAVLVAAAMAMCVPCFAQSDDTMDADLKCLVAVSLLPDINKQSHRLSDEQAQTTALMGTMYYMGKIAGRDPKFDIEDALVKRLSNSDSTAVSADLIRCGNELQDRGAQWQSIGRHLIERAKALKP